MRKHKYEHERERIFLKYLKLPRFERTQIENEKCRMKIDVGVEDPTKD